MQYYTFPISVQAYSEVDAKAKLNLLLSIGSFLVDFKIGDLAGAFVKSKLLECAGKAHEKAVQEATPSVLVEAFKNFEEYSKK